MGLIAVFSSVIILYLLSTFEKHPIDLWTSTISMLQMIILCPTQLFPMRLTLRFFQTWVLISTLSLTTTFLAFHYDFMMRTLFETQIDTFDRFVSNDLMLGGDENTKMYLLEQNLVIKLNVLLPSRYTLKPFFQTSAVIDGINSIIHRVCKCLWLSQPVETKRALGGSRVTWIRTRNCFGSWNFLLQKIE